jgi:hypothetical protein
MNIFIIKNNNRLKLYEIFFMQFVFKARTGFKFYQTYSGFLNASKPKPQFRWVSNGSSSGIRHLDIQLGDINDCAVLHPYLPFDSPLKGEVDPCIYKGHLMKETSTEVLVTGGCEGATNFEVIILHCLISPISFK